MDNTCSNYNVELSSQACGLERKSRSWSHTYGFLKVVQKHCEIILCSNDGPSGKVAEQNIQLSGESHKPANVLTYRTRKDVQELCSAES